MTASKGSSVSNVFQSLLTLVFAGAAVTVAAVAVLRLIDDRAARSAASSLEEREVESVRELVEQATALGDSSASDTVVMFSDYQCPYCKRADSVVAELRARRTRPLAVWVLHLPIDALHPAARSSAIAAECAADQGMFEAFHYSLFAQQAAIPRLDWVSVAKDIGIKEPERFRRCLTDGAAESRVRRHERLASRLGVRGTPAFVFGGRLVIGPAPERLQREILGNENVGASDR